MNMYVFRPITPPSSYLFEVCFWPSHHPPSLHPMSQHPIGVVLCNDGWALSSQSLEGLVTSLVTYLCADRATKFTKHKHPNFEVLSSLRDAKELRKEVLRFRSFFSAFSSPVTSALMTEFADNDGAVAVASLALAVRPFLANLTTHHSVSLRN